MTRSQITSAAAASPPPDKPPPFLRLGPATYGGHVNDRPMRVSLRLKHSLPLDVYTRFAELSR